eukprot:5267977-Pyramimonas_sp.AAC.1
MECEGGVPTLMPVHVKVDLSRFIDAMQYFHCPTVMGPGESDTTGRTRYLRPSHGRPYQDYAKSWCYGPSLRPLD